MAERKRLFRLYPTRFREVWQPPWLNLQHEFKTREVPLSQSLLIWEEELGTPESGIPLLSDFENKKTYAIQEAEDPDGQPTMEVWEQSSETEKPFTAMDTEAFLSFLEPTPQGTDQGFIDLFKRINLGELDLERLKRADLSGAGYSFELVHRDLLIVHSMLLEILSAPREWLLNFSKMVAQDLKNHLPKFYENVQKIEYFEARGENPQEVHADLLRSISNFCDTAKGPLGHIVAYLSSRKVEQFRTEISNTVDTAVDRLGTETNRAEENNNEVAKLRKETQQELNQLKLERQNQQAKQSVSEFTEIFEKQAKAYHEGAQNWLKIAGGVTAVFFLAFIGLSLWLKPGSSEWDGILQNLFAKGFLLSPIYLWLNRSIKNYTAQKHLEVINTHRQKALETFDRFVESAGENPETRHAVLSAATEAIFDANQTGYLSAKSTSSDSRSPVQQVIREIISDKSSPKS